MRGLLNLSSVPVYYYNGIFGSWTFRSIRLYDTVSSLGNEFPEPQWGDEAESFSTNDWTCRLDGVPFALAPQQRHQLFSSVRRFDYRSIPHIIEFADFV